VNLQLAPELREFSTVLARALDAKGGIELARRAEVEPSRVYAEVATLLDQLGVLELPVTSSAAAMVGGVELCRVGGRQLLPYPLPELLTALGQDADAVVVVNEISPHVEHAGALDRWMGVSLQGRVHPVSTSQPPYGSTVSPFVSPVTLLEATGEAVSSLPPMWLAFDAAYIVGALETATRLATDHLSSRVQFGRQLKEFQSLQFRATDMSVVVAGTLELTYYAAWAILHRPGAALTDALAARMAVLEAANDVLLAAHQLHGAIGFTDEHDMSVITRHLQGRLRAPWDLAGTVDRLVSCVEEHGFDGLFTGARP
jgi:hypothetical protein